MFHGFEYPDESEDGKLIARFWWSLMKKGVIEFPRPEECTIRKLVRPMKAQEIQTVGLAEEGLLDGYEEQEANK